MDIRNVVVGIILVLSGVLGGIQAMIITEPEPAVIFLPQSCKPAVPL